MTIQEAKTIHIIDYLQSSGHSPVMIKYGNAWFLSPFRTEKTPSFKIDINKNVWFDFGIGTGGSIIDLVMKVHNVDVSGALSMISSNDYPVTVKPQEYHSTDSNSGAIQIEKLQPLTHYGLLQYLRNRNVKYQFAKRYLQQAYYIVHEKRYFALAFANDKGGFELRSPIFKTGSSPKWFSTIAIEGSTEVSIFEGFMDFLSCCSYYNKFPSSTTIVLNSLSFLPRIETAIAEAKTVNLFLDNDEAGRAATKKIMDSYPNCRDWSSFLYPDHKDFNEFLMRR